MITSLKIKNYIIIESVDISFTNGMTVLTGETGAGKSILIGAIKLVLGGRATSEVIRHGANEAELHASFDIGGNEKVLELLKEAGIGCEDGQLLVRRIINIKGQNKIFINDVSVTLSLLAKLTPLLVDICSQFENQSLFSSTYQLSLVDKYAGNINLVSEFSVIYNDILKTKKELKDLEALDSEREKKLDYYKYQFEEIDSVDPQEDEDSKLEEEFALLSKSKGLFDVIKQIENSFYSDDSSAVSQLESIKSKLSKINLPFTKPYEEKISKMIALAEDVSSGLIAHKKQIKFSSSRSEEISQRLELIRKLKRKYGGTIESVLSKKEDLEKEIKKMESLDSTKNVLKKKLEQLLTQAKKIGKELNEKRVNAANEIGYKISQELQELNMKGSQLKIVVKNNIEAINQYGFDTVEISFAPNKGEAFGLLSKIASGGELSRVTLAIHKILTKTSQNKSYIFDEVDSGIGGDTGRVVGKKLKEISDSNQVICITHLAQVATFGENHFILHKDENNGRVTTSISEIKDFDERTKEIARMLSGRKDQKEALEHAASMLKESK